jgi:hypothetical protein
MMGKIADAEFVSRLRPCFYVFNGQEFSARVEYNSCLH